MKFLLDNLRNLDLKEDNSKYVYTLFDQMPETFQQVVEIPVGRHVLRARANFRFERFYTRDSVKYPPKEKIQWFQRANPPGVSMFYASLYVYNEHDDIGNQLRICTARECLPWLMDGNLDGYQKITFSKWETIEPIKLVAISNYQGLEYPHSYLRELRDDFRLQLGQTGEKSSLFAALSSFISEQFIKKVSASHLEYQISAMFSKKMCDLGFDGLLYPGAPFGGRYLNVALTPFAADSKLKLVCLAESRAYKKNKSITLSNDTLGMCYDQRMPVNYSKVERVYRTTEEECLRKINASRIDELVNLGFL